MNLIDDNRYEVLILGAGIGGGALACILAKHGIRTLLIEELSHPRFTIGESLIPETGVRLQILGEKYGVPELGWLGSFHQLRDHISPACGVKRSFTFCYHREGEDHQPAESTQLPTLTPPFGPDAHLFRQDTDAYLAAAAVRYGATLLQQVKVKGVEFKPDEVVVETASGERYRAGCLIDAGGMRSLVATQLALRDPSPRFATNTRAIYSHFVNLKPYDLYTGGRAEHRLNSPFGQATLHHMFDGGWIWVIPFNNHREATNPLTSIGLMLDRRKHPEPVGTPEEEFWSHIRRYPSVARHFADLRPIRPWVRTGRIQYSSHRVIGDRLIQLPHAAAFVDPLFSSGMSVLTVAIDLIADTLLAAAADRNYSAERFEPINTFTQQAFEHYDMVVSRSFDSFMGWETWNAWNRIWMLGNYLGTWGALKLLLKWYETKDRKYLAASSEPARAGVLGSHLPEVREVMRQSAEEVEAARRGQLTTKEASGRIFARLASLDFVPPFVKLGQPDHRSLATFTVFTGPPQLLWFSYAAPKKWRQYAGFNIFTYTKMVFRFAFGAVFDGFRRTRQSFRDFLFAANGDWHYKPIGMANGEPRFLPPAHSESTNGRALPPLAQRPSEPLALPELPAPAPAMQAERASRP